jgi:sarcosine oxidase
VFIWQIKGRDNGIYGFPAVDGPNGGFKIASENYIEVTTPETVNCIVSLEETESMYQLKVAPFFPLANSKCLRTSVCLYTVAPDSGFVIDWLPSSSSSSSKRIILCSPCSGHGFKHAAAIGEGVAEMVTTGHSRLDMSAFKLERFGSF